MTDKQQLDAGKEIKFGVKSLNEPTPKFMKYILRGITYLGMVWAFVSPQITEIPTEKVAAINKWYLIGLGLMSITIKFFRWDFNADEHQ